MQTFVVRLWTPAQGEIQPEPFALRGVVEHVGFAEPVPFQQREELLRVFERALVGTGDAQATTTLMGEES
jgi:hypothetical protein